MVIVLGLAVISAATVVGPRLGVASPLVLVGIGVSASFLPVFSSVQIEPEWILAGVLPPLLYSSAVSMPAMNFRREFGAISGLSVLLVVGSALVLGLFFTLVIPGLGFAHGVALGAIVSPTDAVATSIVKQTAVSKRVVAMLDGESLLNDATALVLLRTAIAAAATFSFWGTVGSFGYSVVVAAVVGGLVGRLNLLVRARVSDPAVNTVISFTVPFLAFVPAELFHASGLVAAVVAGLVTGIRAPRDLSPQNRVSDDQNWRTVELVLEGAVFLTMGLQIKSIVTSVEADHAGVATAVLVAAGALLVTIAVRAAYVGPLLAILAWRSRRSQELGARLQGMQARMGTPEGTKETFQEMRRSRRKASERDLTVFARRVTQGIADVEYFLRQPLGWRDGTVVVWAGMRGAVTVAAAQSLPEDIPQRSVLVLVAFAVATMSLVVQGGTIASLLRRITPPVDRVVLDQQESAERARIFELLQTSADSVPRPPEPAADGEPGVEVDPGDDVEPRGTLGPQQFEQFELARSHRLAVLAAQRSALLDARDNGTFDADVLAQMLANLDASQIDIEMRGRPSR